MFSSSETRGILRVTDDMSSGEPGFLCVIAGSTNSEALRDFDHHNHGTTLNFLLKAIFALVSVFMLELFCFFRRPEDVTTQFLPDGGRAQKEHSQEIMFTY